MREPVFHEKYGKGIAAKKRYGGFEKFVRFSSGIEKWIKRNELKPYSTKEIESQEVDHKENPIIIHKKQECEKVESTPTTSLKTAEIAPEVVKPITKPASVKDEDKEISQPTKTKTVKDISSRTIIEALRLGGVPQRNVEKFTFGRDTEIDEVKVWLTEEKGSLMLTGNYGVGKSHLLEVITSMALENSWAVARVEIDPEETPFHKPKKIYDHVVNSLSFKQENKVLGFNELIEKIVESKNDPDKEKLIGHPYLGKLLINWNHGDKSELLEWIRGDGSNPYMFPRLVDYQTASNIYCNIMSGLGWAAKNILGLNGVLILFDEAEGIDPFWYTTYQFEKARNFLKGSILMSNNDTRLIGDAGKSFSSRKLDLIYCRASKGAHTHSFLWEEKSHVKFIFSFVPEMLEFMEKYRDLFSLFNEMDKIEIETLNHDDLKCVFERIVDIYNDAYLFSANPDFYHFIPDGKTRRFVKGTVEGLDLIRFNPDRTPDELLESYE